MSKEKMFYHRVYNTTVASQDQADPENNGEVFELVKSVAIVVHTINKLVSGLETEGNFHSGGSCHYLISYGDHSLFQNTHYMAVVTYNTSGTVIEVFPRNYIGKPDSVKLLNFDNEIMKRHILSMK